MRVGMNRGESRGREKGMSVPHACGDEPMTELKDDNVKKCSPCVWG